MINRFRKGKLFSLILLLFLFTQIFTLPWNSAQSTLEISDKFGTQKILEGKYIIQNNIWGANTSQTISIPNVDTCQFTVSESNHNQTNVASYPSIYHGSHWGKDTNNWKSHPIKDLAEVSFFWSVDPYRPAGIYNVAAEAWFSNHNDTSAGYEGGTELMIWMDNHGMHPSGEKIDTFEDYDLYYDNWGWHYLCYYKTSQNTANINLIDFINDAISHEFLNNSMYLHAIEAGFEICSGGKGLSLTNFDVKIKKANSAVISGFSLEFFIGILILITTISKLKIKRKIKLNNFKK